MINVQAINNSTRKPLANKALVDCATKVFAHEGKTDVSVLIVLSDNQKVRELGKEFLEHDYDTDVITFDLSEEDSKLIEGEIYIGVEQAEMQAQEYGVSMTDELKRLSVHGALHLCGYLDTTPEEREAMRLMENKFI